MLIMGLWTLDWGCTEEENSASPCSTHSKTRDFIYKKKGQVEQGRAGFGMIFLLQWKDHSLSQRWSYPQSSVHSLMINIVHAWNFMNENEHSYELLLFMYDILDHGYERLLIMDDRYWSCVISWPEPPPAIFWFRLSESSLSRISFVWVKSE